MLRADVWKTTTLSCGLVALMHFNGKVQSFSHFGRQNNVQKDEPNLNTYSIVDIRYKLHYSCVYVVVCFEEQPNDLRAWKIYWMTSKLRGFFSVTLRTLFQVGNEWGHSHLHMTDRIFKLPVFFSKNWMLFQAKYSTLWMSVNIRKCKENAVIAVKRPTVLHILSLADIQPSPAIFLQK